MSQTLQQLQHLSVISKVTAGNVHGPRSTDVFLCRSFSAASFVRHIPTAAVTVGHRLAWTGRLTAACAPAVVSVMILQQLSCCMRVWCRA
jgi:hypothetical protein